MNMRYLLPTMSLYVTDDFLQVKKIYNSIARNTLYDFIAFFFRGVTALIMQISITKKPLNLTLSSWLRLKE